MSKFCFGQARRAQSCANALFKTIETSQAPSVSMLIQARKERHVRINVFLIFTAFAILVSQLFGQSGGNEPTHSYHLVLSVKLQDPFNRDFEIRTPVHLGKPFHATAKNGSVINDISGTVRAAKAGKFALKLTVLEWQSAKSNMRDTTNFQLDLDKPQIAGPISSFIYLRTVTLSRPISWRAPTAGVTVSN
jgi:hypothetical protein